MAVSLGAMSDPLFQMAYVSAATHAFSSEQLRNLLAAARENNERVGITGLLVHKDGSFLQILEGPEGAVRRLYEQRIMHDTRHARVLRIFGSNVSERSFDTWTMGFVEPSEALAEMPGFNDFLKTGFARTGYTDNLAARVRSLALQFRIGRWRQHLDTDGARF